MKHPRPPIIGINENLVVFNHHSQINFGVRGGIKPIGVLDDIVKHLHQYNGRILNNHRRDSLRGQPRLRLGQNIRGGGEIRVKLPLELAGCNTQVRLSHGLDRWHIGRAQGRRNIVINRKNRVHVG